MSRLSDPPSIEGGDQAESSACSLDGCSPGVVLGDTEKSTGADRVLSVGPVCGDLSCDTLLVENLQEGDCRSKSGQ